MKTADLSPEQLDAVRRQLATGKDPRAIVVTRTEAKRKSGEPNKTEASYGRYLEYERDIGRVKWFGFEKFKVRIGKRCWLRIDYFVVFSDGSIELVDVKGRKGERYYCKDDSKVKLRSVADDVPFTVVIVWPLKGGGWGREEMA